MIGGVLIILVANLLYSELNISGVNEFKYIYSNRIIEHRNYFSDKFQLQTQFNSFRAGIKYDLHYPKFGKFIMINDDMDDSAIENMLMSEEDQYYFLKTIIPNSEAKKKYTEGNNG